jgi:hypothetical protein
MMSPNPTATPTGAPVPTGAPAAASSPGTARGNGNGPDPGPGTINSTINSSGGGSGSVSRLDKYSMGDGADYDDDSDPYVPTGEEGTGRWTKEEHDLFLAALEIYGKVSLVT